MGIILKDSNHLTAIILQALWFVSPVVMEKRMFESGPLSSWDQINPISNILEIFRSFVGEFLNYSDALAAYLNIGLSILITALISILLHKKYASKVIFYVT